MEKIVMYLIGVKACLILSSICVLPSPTTITLFDELQSKNNDVKTQQN